MDRPVDDDAASGGAALARGADGAEIDGAQGDFEIPLLAHDDGAVAAQFEDVAPEALLHQLAHMAAARDRARV